MKKNLSKNLAVTMRIILQDDEGVGGPPGAAERKDNSPFSCYFSNTPEGNAD